MDPFALSAISKDPNSGIRIVVKRITVMLPAAGGGVNASVKEKFTETLNAQKHKYLPDIGGYLLGYTDVKYKESVFEWSKDDNVPQSVKVKAKFYIFSPVHQMTLRCTVTDRTKEKIRCKAFNHFPVEVHHPAQIWDTVTKGDLVLVEVDLVSQPAHQTPVIIGRIKMNESHVENIDFDEDTEVEEESSEMEVGETHSGDTKIDEDEERTISTKKSKGSKKRKADDVSTSQDIAQRSPVKTRVKKDDTSEQSPVSGDSGHENNADNSKNDTGFHEKLLPVDELLSLKSPVSDNRRSDCFLHDGISPILRPSKSMPLYDQGKNSETKVVSSLKTVESYSMTRTRSRKKPKLFDLPESTMHMRKKKYGFL